MKSAELRWKFLDFFKDRGHKIIPSASLIPEGDSSTLFISSGMQPLVPYLLGQKHPKGVRLTDSQKSFRTEDIEEVGDGRHNTFFEMLGNWSLGDYFKKEQLTWIYSFLIDEIKIDASRLYATVFRGEEVIGVPKDSESVDILKQVFKTYGIDAKDVDFPENDGMQDGRIFYYPAKKNWWSKSGTPEKMPIGEIGGPDSEIFYDLGPDLKKHENSEFKGALCHVNCDCGRFIEIGNSVFIEYKKTQQGFEKLEQQNVDFGGGLERMTMVSEGLDNIFETDLFLHIIKKIEGLSGKRYRDDRKSFEVIADHIKSATFIMGDGDGISPNNTGQGYIVRRLVRRAIRFGKKLGITEKKWTKEIATIVTADYKDVYSELEKNITFIGKELKKEEEKFNETLERGLKELNGIKKWWGQIRRSSVNDMGSSGNYSQGTDQKREARELGVKLFYLYQSYGLPIELSLEELGGIIFEDEAIKSFNEELKKHQELSRTASAGMFKGGLADDEPETIKLHTAHHLLLAALQELFGKQVKQKGSNINSERLRIDFSFDRKITAEEIKKLEDMVNEKIHQGLDVVKRELPLEEAQKIGAEMEFGVKYGNMVSVYFIEDKKGNAISKEFCGGPHVKNTSELGTFKIIKEEASSQGVRRIKAILE